jgi:hypothetical protein
LRVEALRLLEVTDVCGYVVKHQSSLHGPGPGLVDGASRAYRPAAVPK